MEKMKNTKEEKSYIIMDLIYGNFWDGNFYNAPEKSKSFSSREEAEIEIKERILPTFRCIASIKEVYINL
jgi:hypothetical protein